MTPQQRKQQPPWALLGQQGAPGLPVALPPPPPVPPGLPAVPNAIPPTPTIRPIQIGSAKVTPPTGPQFPQPPQAPGAGGGRGGGQGTTNPMAGYLASSLMRSIGTQLGKAFDQAEGLTSTKDQVAADMLRLESEAQAKRRLEQLDPANFPSEQEKLKQAHDNENYRRALDGKPSIEEEAAAAQKKQEDTAAAQTRDKWLNPDKHYDSTVEGLDQFAIDHIKQWPNLTPDAVQQVFAVHQDLLADPAAWWKAARNDFAMISQQGVPSAQSGLEEGRSVAHGAPDFARIAADKAANPYASLSAGTIDALQKSDWLASPLNVPYLNTQEGTFEGGPGMLPPPEGETRAQQYNPADLGTAAGYLGAGAITGGLVQGLRKGNILQGVAAGAAIAGVTAAESLFGKSPAIEAVGQAVMNGLGTALPAELVGNVVAPKAHLGPKAFLISAGLTLAENVLPGGNILAKGIEAEQQFGQPAFDWFQKNIAGLANTAPDLFNYLNQPEVFNAEAFYQMKRTEAEQVNADPARQVNGPVHVPTREDAEKARQEQLAEYFPAGRPPDLTLDLVGDFAKLKNFANGQNPTFKPEDLSVIGNYTGLRDYTARRRAAIAARGEQVNILGTDVGTTGQIQVAMEDLTNPITAALFHGANEASAGTGRGLQALGRGVEGRLLEGLRPGTVAEMTRGIGGTGETPNPPWERRHPVTGMRLTSQENAVIDVLTRQRQIPEARAGVASELVRSFPDLTPDQVASFMAGDSSMFDQPLAREANAATRAEAEKARAAGTAPAPPAAAGPAAGSTTATPAGPAPALTGLVRADTGDPLSRADHDHVNRWLRDRTDPTKHDMIRTGLRRLGVTDPAAITKFLAEGDVTPLRPKPAAGAAAPAPAAATTPAPAGAGVAAPAPAQPAPAAAVVPPFKTFPAPGLVKLPDTLKGGGGWWNLGKDKGNKKLIFESDIDKALYIIGGTKKSGHHDEYVAWLMKVHPGLNIGQINEMAARVRKAFRPIVEAETGNEVRIPDQKAIREPPQEPPAAPPAKPVEPTPSEPPAAAGPAVEEAPPAEVAATAEPEPAPVVVGEAAPADVNLAEPQPTGLTETALAGEEPPAAPVLPQGKPLAGAAGNTFTIPGITDPNKEYRFRYRVVGLDDPITSHNADFSPNPAYDQRLQGRRREAVASQLETNRKAANYAVGAALNDNTLDRGPPIVGPDSMVESGNGRLMALRLVKERDPERFAEYQRQLQEKLAELGIDPAEIAGIKDPVLVRERLTAMEEPERLAFAEEGNLDSSEELSEYDQAAQDAKHLSMDVVTNLKVGSSENIDAVIKGNPKLYQRFIQSLTPGARRTLLTEDATSLTARGLQRIRNALVALAYKGPQARKLGLALIEGVGEEGLAVREAFQRNVPAMVRLVAKIDEGARAANLDPTAELANAVDVLTRLRQNGRRLGEFLPTDWVPATSSDVAAATKAKQFTKIPFDMAKGGATELSQTEARILRYIYTAGKSSTKIRNLLDEYVGTAEATPDTRMQDMFGGALGAYTPDREKIFNDILDRLEALDREAATSPLEQFGAEQAAAGGATAGAADVAPSEPAAAAGPAPGEPPSGVAAPPSPTAGWGSAPNPATAAGQAAPSVPTGPPPTKLPLPLGKTRPRDLIIPSRDPSSFSPGEAIKVTFASDIDRALYEVGSAITYSDYPAYLSWLRQALPEKTDDQIRTMGYMLHDLLRQTAVGVKGATLKVADTGIKDWTIPPPPESLDARRPPTQRLDPAHLAYPLGSTRMDRLTKPRIDKRAQPQPEDTFTPEKTGIKVGSSNEMLKRQAASQYPGDMNRTVVKELLQNSVDASRTTPGAVTTVEAFPSQRLVVVKDQGIGMSRATVDKAYVELMSSEKIAGTASGGGYGSAKLAYMGNSDLFGMRTVNRDKITGKLMETLYWGTGDDVFNQNMNVITRPVGAFPQHVLDQLPEALRGPWQTDSLGRPMPGTWTSTRIRPEADWASNGAKQFMDSFLKHHMLTDQKVTFAVDGQQLIQPSITAPHEELADQRLGQTEVKGATLVFYATKAARPRGYLMVDLLNAGMPQGQLSVDFRGERKLPYIVKVDVIPKVEAGTYGYPWTPDRRGLTDIANRAVKDWATTHLVEESAKQDIKAAEAALANAVPIPHPTKATTTLKMFSETAQAPGLSRELASRPYVQTLAHALKGIHDSFVAAAMGEGVPKSTFFGFGTSNDWLGINMQGLGGVAHARVSLSPWKILGAVDGWYYGQTDKMVPQLAKAFIDTIVHEIAHNVAKGHELPFSEALTRIPGQIGYAQIAYHGAALERLIAPIWADAAQQHQWYADMYGISSGGERSLGKFSETYTGEDLGPGRAGGVPPGGDQSGGGPAGMERRLGVPPGAGEAGPGREGGVPGDGGGGGPPAAPPELGGFGTPPELPAAGQPGAPPALGQQSLTAPERLARFGLRIPGDVKENPLRYVTAAAIGGFTVAAAMERGKREALAGKPETVSDNPILQKLATLGARGVEARDVFDGLGIYSRDLASPFAEAAFEIMDLAPTGIWALTGAKPDLNRRGFWTNDVPVAFAQDMIPGHSQSLNDWYQKLKARAAARQQAAPAVAFMAGLPFDPLNWFGWEAGASTEKMLQAINATEATHTGMSVGEQVIGNGFFHASAGAVKERAAEDMGRRWQAVAGSTMMRPDSIVDSIDIAMRNGTATADEQKLAFVLGKPRTLDTAGVQKLMEHLGAGRWQMTPTAEQVTAVQNRAKLFKNGQMSRADVEYFTNLFEQEAAHTPEMENQVAQWIKAQGMDVASVGPGKVQTPALTAYLDAVHKVTPAQVEDLARIVGRTQPLHPDAVTMRQVKDWLVTARQAPPYNAANFQTLRKYLGVDRKLLPGNPVMKNLNQWAATYTLPDLTDALARAERSEFGEFQKWVIDQTRRQFPESKAYLQRVLDQYPWGTAVMRSWDRLAPTLVPLGQAVQKVERTIVLPLQLTYLATVAWPLHAASELGLRAFHPAVIGQTAKAYARAAKGLARGKMSLADATAELRWWHQKGAIPDVFGAYYNPSFMYGRHGLMQLGGGPNALQASPIPLVGAGFNRGAANLVRTLGGAGSPVRPAAAAQTAATGPLARIAQALRPATLRRAVVEAGATAIEHATVGDFYDLEQHFIGSLDAGARQAFIALNHPKLFKQVVAQMSKGDKQLAEALLQVQKAHARPLGLTDTAWNRLEGLVDSAGHRGQMTDIIDGVTRGTIDRTALARHIFANYKEALPYFANSEIWAILTHATPEEMQLYFRKGGPIEQLVSDALEFEHGDRIGSLVQTVTDSANLRNPAGVKDAWAAINSSLHTAMQMHRDLWEWAWQMSEHLPREEKDVLFGKVRQYRQQLLAAEQHDSNRARLLFWQKVQNRKSGAVALPPGLRQQMDDLWKARQSAFAETDDRWSQYWAKVKLTKRHDKQALSDLRDANEKTWQSYRAERLDAEELIHDRLMRYFQQYYRKGGGQAENADLVMPIAAKTVPPAATQAAMAALEQIRPTLKHFIETPTLDAKQTQILQRWAEKADATVKLLPPETTDKIQKAHEATARLVMEEGNRRFVDYTTRTNFDEFMRSFFPFWMYDYQGGNFYKWLMTHVPGAWSSGQHYEQMTQGTGNFDTTGMPTNEIFGTSFNPMRGLWPQHMVTLSNQIASYRPKGAQQVIDDFMNNGLAGFRITPGIGLPTEIARGKNITELDWPGMAQVVDDLRAGGLSDVANQVGAVGVTGGWGAGIVRNDPFTEYKVNNELAAMGVDINKATPEQLREAQRRFAVQDLPEQVLPRFNYKTPEQLTYKPDFQKELQDLGHSKADQARWLNDHPGSSIWGILNAEEKRGIFQRHPGWSYLLQASEAFDDAPTKQRKVAVGQAIETLNGITADRLKEQNIIDARLTKQAITPREWVKQHSKLSEQTFGARSLFDKSNAASILRDDQSTRVLTQEDAAKLSYYSKRAQWANDYTDPSTGLTDWARVEQATNAFMASQSPEIQRYIQAEVERNWTPTEKAYHQALNELSAYDKLPRYQGVSADDEAARAVLEAKFTQLRNYDTAASTAYYNLPANKLLRKRMLVSKERVQFLLDHPLFRSFFGNPNKATLQALSKKGENFVDLGALTDVPWRLAEPAPEQPLPEAAPTPEPDLAPVGG